jgi:hypothetical protein
MNANFPTYSPSEGDKTSLKADRGADGVLKVTMRGDVFDGRGFLKSAISGKEADPKTKAKNIDLDVDVKLGAVAGFNGEAVRSVDVKLSRRNGTIRSFALSGKLGRDTPLTGDLRRPAQGRDVIYLETNDAGAFFRFNDTYSKVVGARSPGCGRAGRRSERRFLLARARGIHPPKRAAHDPGGRTEGPDDRRDHRRQYRFRKPGAHERHLRSDVRAEQHVRPNSDCRAVPRRRQQ